MALDGPNREIAAICSIRYCVGTSGKVEAVQSAFGFGLAMVIHARGADLGSSQVRFGVGP